MTELFEKLVSILKKKNLTISTAESCTGGLVAKCFTDISGVSEVFYGGVVSYDNKVKMGVLGVEGSVLDTLGAVSSPVAEQMARGVCRACFTDIGISTTGIAGPGGGTKEKPVGTVYIGAFIDGVAHSRLLQIDPALSRDKIRHEATRLLIEFVISLLEA
ncbi:MAG: nicotinamide-nucleotide amidohydrolase family protein [Clostridia bacterium]|nr:nicotinamide-nucleotide amidohydrolase family protein [Clostridia bacterium]